MKKSKLLLLAIIQCVTVLAQNTGTVTGKVTDKQTNEPLPGATVAVKGNTKTAVTNNEGDFILKNVGEGNIVLLISYVGYATMELPVHVTAGNTTIADANLAVSNRIGDEVVVSASKRPEKITNAPASVHVINTRDFEQFAGSNINELVSKVQGVEYVRSGIDGITFNARGFNNAFNNKVLQLIDGRNSMAALSGGLPLFNNCSSIKEDIERLEIVLGPQTALYGPNAHNAVFNTITKDPRKYQGTTISLSAGNHYQFSGRLRHAVKINNRWAYKLTGEYAVGKEYIFYDTVYAGGNAGPVPNGFGPPVAIPEKSVDFNFRHIRGEAHVYYSVTPKADIILSGGGSNNNYLQVTTSGRNQQREFTYSFLQARLVHPNYFVNVYNTWGNIGTSYTIASYTRDFWNRTHSTITSGPLYPAFGKLPPDSAELFALRPGNQFKEKSQRTNAEAQYNYNFQKAGLFLVAGLSYQNERPNGYGIALVDKDERIHINQYGAALQLEKSLPWSMRFIGAARLDHHSNFGSFFSPKLALVKQAGDGSFRLTWGRAYAMPGILFQYANIGGILFGNGEGITYQPNGPDFSKSAVKVTTALQPEEVSTWEIGYKGTIARKLFIDINYYNGLSKNFLSPTMAVGGRAIAVGKVPVTPNPAFAGFVDEDTLKGASFLTWFNYGEVRAYGVDVGLSYYFNSHISLAVKYSWFGSGITDDDLKNDANNDGYVSAEERCLNAPKNKGLVMLGLQNLCKQKAFANLSARLVQQYDFYSGNQVGTADGEGKRGTTDGPNGPVLKNFDWGPLGGFVTVDVSAGYKLNEALNVAMGITNLFNTKQIEFVGSPSVGRLITFEVTVQVPNARKK